MKSTNQQIRFGSVCSGIEAASVAWSPLGWKAAWLSEIDPFASAVLAHHYPDVQNLGDMTKLPARIMGGEIEAPDVFCGGTPCQAFSIAGLRKSLDDARGNLSLIFCEIANAIDSVRDERGEQPAVIFWENVPGVLNTKDNAFGCFLAGLAGEDDPLVAPGDKWTNAGYVLGPKRAVAWRILDAQYFGTAQQRRRVFVVGCSTAGRIDPFAILFERESTGLHSPENGSGEVERERIWRRDTSPAFTRNYSRGVHCGGEGYIKECDGRLRRFTPVEVERLFGFPDNYTAVTWRKKPAEDCPDGPRYKALGNSWAVPNVRWIGERISKELAKCPK